MAKEERPFNLSHQLSRSDFHPFTKNKKQLPCQNYARKYLTLVVLLRLINFRSSCRFPLSTLIYFQNILELKSSLEEIAGYCMAILEQVLEKQPVFLELSKHHMSSMIVSPLDELLLSVNPRTGRPDYLCMIARYELRYSFS